MSVLFYSQLIHTPSTSNLPYYETRIAENTQACKEIMKPYGKTTFGRTTTEATYVRNKLTMAVQLENRCSK
jgi:hypothetical protein